FRHWLPLAFVPAVSGTAWVVSGVPLLALMVQTGQTALSITVRYALAVVPGVFYGAIVWWSYNAKRFTPKFRRLWVSCMALSIVFAISANPNRTLYFLIPDSFVPWVHVSLPRQWQHSSAAQQVIRTVPPDASVSATTYLIPPLSSRHAIIRLPLLQFKDDRGEVRTVDYLAADLWQLQQYQVAFKEERDTLRRLVPLIEQTIADSSYGLRAVEDGVVLLQKGVASDATALANWTQYRKELGAIVDRVS
ncbi:DUF2079 domain-containing protein, partial [Leptolyngbya sp. FACHB-36]|uniref:DUF2079 domain-containing protein n=1 Tax=Leptolyngbya sp. FACHB-36 TaxID=2692808 RepID=UPI001681A194